MFTQLIDLPDKKWCSAAAESYRLNNMNLPGSVSIFLRIISVGKALICPYKILTEKVLLKLKFVFG